MGSYNCEVNKSLPAPLVAAWLVTIRGKRLMQVGSFMFDKTPQKTSNLQLGYRAALRIDRFLKLCISIGEANMRGESE